MMGFLHYADGLAVAGRTRAVHARVGVSKIVANATLADVALGFADGVGQGQGLLGSGAQQMKCQPLCRLLPNAWQALQLVNEAINGCGEVRHRRGPVRAAKRRGNIGSRIPLVYQSVRTIQEFPVRSGGDSWRPIKLSRE